MSSGNKRKRSAPTEPINVSHGDTHDFPPIVATTRGVALPNLPFVPYVSTEHAVSTSTKKSSKRSRPEYLLHATNPRLDYEGREAKEDAEFHRYYIGIYDPTSNSVEFHPAPKVQVSSTIKTKRETDANAATLGKTNNRTYDESREALGKAFGTRKAQNSLISREMNKVDVKMDRDLTRAIMSEVADSTTSIPSQDMLNKTMSESRPIPPFNAAADSPAGVYSRDDIISPEEWESIWIGDWTKAGEAHVKSSYVANRANVLLQDQGKKHTTKLKLLRYIAWMVDFYTAAQKARGKLPPVFKAKNIMLGAGQQVVDGMYARFAEASSDPMGRTDAEGNRRENERYTVSPRLEGKLLYYMAVLCLMADNYDVDIFDLRQDLNLQPKEIADAFKQVGCSVRDLSKTQITNAKMTKAEAAQHKKAVLKIPLEFPPPPRKRAAKAGRR